MSEVPDRTAAWRRVLMPAEHGGWAFLGEPILLGLLVAPSLAGTWLAVAATAGFVARQPLRLAVADRRHGRRYPRTVQAERGFVAFAMGGALALATSVFTAEGPVLWALGMAAPLAATALAFDLGRRSRELPAELAAVAALGSVAAGIALATGAPRGEAFGLWGVLAARAVPSVLVVRARLRLDRGESAGVAGALAASLAGAVAGIALAATHAAPWWAAGALGLLVLRAAWALSPARPRWTTPQLGVSEIVAGLVVVLATWAGIAFAR